MNTAKDEVFEFGDEFLNHLKEKEAWSKLSDDEEFKWTEELIEKYAEKIDWSSLSCNRNIAWSVDLIEKYKNKIQWEDFSQYFFWLKQSRPFKNNSKSYPRIISIYLEKFAKYWDWSQVSRHIQEINDPIIDQFLHKWDWKELIDNDEVRWTPEKFKKYQKYIPISRIQDFTNSRLWDQLVEHKFERVKAKLLLES